MAKHNGITIRISAAHDTVTVHDKVAGSIVFDRNEMRKQGHTKDVGALRRTVVDAWKRQNNVKTYRYKGEHQAHDVHLAA